jgi:hypothetical protein
MEFELFEELPTSANKTSNESLLGTGIRNVARLGARAIESTAGLPGTIESAGRGLLNLGSRAITGSPLVSSNTIFPTPENIREIGRPGANGYLEPQGNIEKFGDEFISDFIPLVVGGTGLANAAKISGIGNIAGLATKHITGSEGAGDLVKAGTILGTSLWGTPKLKDVARDAYKKAESLLPEGAQVESASLRPIIDKVEHRLSKGFKEGLGKKELGSLVGQLQDKITSGGKIAVSDLLQSKQELNEIIGDIIDKEGRLKGIFGTLPELNNSIKDAISGYSKVNPEFVKNLKQADDMWQGIYHSAPISQWIKKHVNKHILKYAGTAALLGAGKVGVGAAAGLAAKGYVGLKALETTEQLLRSPSIRKHYLAALKAAASENAAVFTRQISKLDQEIGKQESQESGDFELFQ